MRWPGPIRQAPVMPGFLRQARRHRPVVVVAVQRRSPYNMAGVRAGAGHAIRIHGRGRSRGGVSTRSGPAAADNRLRPRRPGRDDSDDLRRAGCAARSAGSDARICYRDCRHGFPGEPGTGCRRRQRASDRICGLRPTRGDRRGSAAAGRRGTGNVAPKPNSCRRAGRRPAGRDRSPGYLCCRRGSGFAACSGRRKPEAIARPGSKTGRGRAEFRTRRQESPGHLCCGWTARAGGARRASIGQSAGGADGRAIQARSRNAGTAIR